MILKPQASDSLGCGGIFNPAAARGPDGTLYLFPRLVSADGVSRIGRCRVRFDGAGSPVGVESIDVALEPEADYERHPQHRGCEDARVVFCEPLGRYVMTYTAVGPEGPRVALATSVDLIEWQRLGLARFQSTDNFDLGGMPNKNAVLFPFLVPGPGGQPRLAMLHRPLFPDRAGLDLVGSLRRTHGAISRDYIWMSYADIAEALDQPGVSPLFRDHHRLDVPSTSWNRLRIGAGVPPLKVEGGYLVFYHGVSATKIGLDGTAVYRLKYSAGAFVLDERDPQHILYHTAEPLLAPEGADELDGVVPRVVFPTGADRRIDIGQADRFDLYYGMADSRIGVARIDVNY